MRTKALVWTGAVLSACVWGPACAPTHEDTSALFEHPDPQDDAAAEAAEADRSLLFQPDGEIAPAVPSGEGQTCTRGQAPTQDPYPVDADAPLEQGLLRVKRGDQWMGLPLQGTSFDTRVLGTLAETTVTQTFKNTYDVPIEAVYAFPLPEDGAVDDYWFHVGARHIHGVMKKREEARKLYEDAKQQGKSAALLEQERPNIFTQSVANIAPGETVEVEMHLVHPLHQEDGRYALSLPTVVGPRFIPGAPTGTRAGGGRLLDTDAVPDASRITPPVMPKGQVTCAPITIAVGIEAGMPVHSVASQYHRVATARAGDRLHVELARDGELPNRDFVLSWSLAGDAPQAAMITETRPSARGGKDDDGYFTLTIQPPRLPPPPDKLRPRELIFVVDNSGSMHGTPINTAKATVHKALDTLGPSDSFQIIRFSESASALGAGPLASTPDNVARGKRYIDDMHGTGGTQMIEGIKAALGMPKNTEIKRADESMRVVLFLTDGYIGNEVQIFSEIEQRLGETRLFSLGVGSSVNRYLLDGMAAVGRGAVTYMGPGEQPDAIVDRFYERIAHPVLTDISIDWGEVEIQEVYPQRVPDLFSGQPVVVYGRFKGGAPEGAVALNGRLGGERVSIPLALDPADTVEGDGVASMWARKKIDAINGYPSSLGHRDDAEATAKRERAIVDVALEYRVMSEFTSFVAVDEQRITNPDGTVRVVQQPVDVPVGVDRDHAVGESYGVGGLGLVGTGRGGGGTGSGTIGLGNTGFIGKGGGGGTGSGYGRGSGGGFGGRGKRVPMVRQGKAQVQGALDKDIIRRIVRAHINEVRHCYNQGLSKDPNMKGRVAVQFTIGGA
ncbi:MAG: AgmX/PglI C-terminal domain-containing protein, partial [Myxococcales bacterium]|nr:AgmX/PglI C-terminal domain-containing protein [Myxococcales bacterium]